ncbi:dioxygenase [Saccharopolyspora sp. K220]|uniref:dioxygenase family protein n=1 Tax=Saccharopolyspora soli TaxID=2926618 RepID=UPI001F5997D3|nr:class III extradiol ring-cleavage dioxygenase [Saccharopolyspora soli]MCI2419519.1 dioxygenase [Saccharopolyspora soli]
MPVVYLSHGSPRLADDQRWKGELTDWSAELPRPTAILIISAHWEEAPLTLGATTTAPLVYDFWGFPERFYQVTYEAPGAPQLAAKVRGLLRSTGTPLRDDPVRGLDHGAYVPLAEMYPDADIPVLQISMPTLAPEELLRLGGKLAPLRDEGVLIIGSGFFTHNLSGMDRSDRDAAAQAWSSEFDDWGRRVIAERDVDSLIDFENKAPAARLAHPTSDHLVPLFVSLGASLDRGDQPRAVIEGYWHGLAKRSVQFG